MKPKQMDDGKDWTCKEHGSVLRQSTGPVRMDRNPGNTTNPAPKDLRSHEPVRRMDRNPGAGPGGVGGDVRGAEGSRTIPRGADTAAATSYDYPGGKQE